MVDQLKTEKGTLSIGGFSGFTEQDIPVFDDFQFTPESLKKGIKEQGIGNLAASIAEMQSGTAPQGLFSYKTLRDGTAPLLNFLPDFKDKPLEDRPLNDEQILTLFTNVEDYKGDIVRAAKEKSKRTIAPAGGMFAGAVAGAKGAAKLPIPHPIAKGAVILGGTILGALTGDFFGRETSDFLLGEEVPVVPSLQPVVNTAETLTYGVSMLATPWVLPTQTGAIGAVRVLDNFKKISMGKNANLAKKGYYDFDRAIDVIANSEGLTKSLLNQALRAEPRTGLSKFIKPDPRKGPVSLRILSGIEKGTAKAGQAARANPVGTLAFETLAAGGAGGAAFASEVAFPGNDFYRLIGETLGAAAPPLLTKPFFSTGKYLVSSGGNLIKRYYSGPDPSVDTAAEAIQTKRMKQVGDRLFGALQDSKEIQENPELLGKAIKMLGQNILDETNTIVDEKNIAVLESTSLSAFFASRNEPKLAKVFARIEQELGRTSDELAIASKKGREAYIQGAKAVIIGAVNAGDVDALEASGFVAESLFYDNISNNVKGQVFNLLKAADRLKTSPKGELSTRLYNALKDQIRISKLREGQLWDAVGEAEVAQFVNGKGEELELPNVVIALQSFQRDGGVRSNAEGAFGELRKALGDYTKDLDKILRYFDAFTVFDADARPTNILFNPSVDAELTPVRRSPMMASRLFDVRSELLEKAKILRAQAKPKNKLAKKIETIAMALEQDLIGVPNAASNNYNIARAYTKARNDFFTRSFLGDIQDLDAQGAFRITEDNLLDKLFAGGSSPTYLRFKDIMAANKFLLQQDLGQPIEGQELAGSMFENIATINETLQNATRRVYRKMTTDKVVDVTPDGQEITAPVIDPKKYEDYVRSDEAQAMFRVFPALYEDLKTLKRAQESFISYGKDAKLFKESDNVKAFQAVLESRTENPSSAVTEAINSKRPEAAIQALLDLTETAPSFKNAAGKSFTQEEAKLGLRSAILSYAITKAGGTGYPFNPQAFQDALFGIVKTADPKSSFRLSSFMLKNDVIDQQHLSMMQKAIKEMVNVEEAFLTGDLETVLFKKPSGSKMFGARMIGATLGAAAQRRFNDLLTKIGIGSPGSGQLGGGLVAASEGSKQALNLFFNMPEQAKVKIMLELFQDKKKLGLLLQEAQTAAQAGGLANRLAVMLNALGVEQVTRRAGFFGRELGTEFFEEEDLIFPETIEEEEPPVQSKAPSLPLPAFKSTQPPTNIAQVSPTLNPLPNTQKVDRRRYAAAFPEDRALVEGIGSLRG